MDSRVPTSIQGLLGDYVQLLSEIAPGLVTGLYIHGSIALDAFDEDLSDIDFVAFLSRSATPNDLEKLAEIHQSIASRHPRWLLEGSYLQWHDQGRIEEEIPSAPNHHDNNFVASGNFDVNLVTWWLLKNRGITLIGPQAQGLPSMWSGICW